MVKRSPSLSSRTANRRPGPARRARARRTRRAPKLEFAWARAISASQWRHYRSAIRALRRAGIPFLLGGGFALAVYTGRWRNTKDIDFYIRKTDRDAAVRALARAGFRDYFRQLPYDRKWIYRSTRSGVIVDLIWAMANQRATTDPIWFERAPRVRIRGEQLFVVPMEEFLWCKLYIMQRDHCDWTDVINLLHAVGADMDWDHVLERVGDDHPLLQGVLAVYGWLAPQRLRRLPPALRARLGIRPAKAGGRSVRERVRLLDSREWFAALVPRNKTLAI